MVELEPTSCRICLSITQQNERQLLFSDDTTLSDVGILYEDVLSLPISVERITLKYICNSCDLQLKLFNQLKHKAVETFLLLEDIGELSEENIFKNCVISENNHGIKSEIIEEIDEIEETTDYHENSLDECEDKEDIDEIEDIQYLDEERIVENDDEIQDEEYLFETDVVKSYCPSESSSGQIEACCDRDETIKLKTNLSNHKRKLNSKTKRYRCTLCPKTMYSEEALQVHLNVHKGLPAYQCNLCGKTFKQKNHFNYHMLNHRNERNIICELCQKGFLSKSDLKIHMRVHTDERRYTCDVCGKKFRAHTHMINHRYSHFEKQFKCPECHQKYVSPNTLRTHIKSVHIGEVPHECELCEKKFKRKHHLLAHYKTHNKGVETLTSQDQTLASNDNQFK